MSKLDDISEYINHLSFDLKAEMLVAVLAERSVELGEILTAFDGQLKRIWSRDVAWSAVDHLETGDQMLSLHLNRDGIYDVLPEALFHSYSGNEDQSVEEMAKDSMKLRTEEKEIRSFFQPFENEIFLERVQLSMIENQLFTSLNTECLTGIIPYLWRVDTDLPEIYVVRLKKLLPLVHKITGDLTLTAKCLEFILKEKVEVTIAEENTYDDRSRDFLFSGILGKSTLGYDTISGGQIDDLVNRLIFTIGPITNPATNELVKKGKMDSFLECFYSYLMPFEYEICTKYLFEEEQGLLMLNDKTDAKISYLGYNSVIQ